MRWGYHADGRPGALGPRRLGKTRSWSAPLGALHVDRQAVFSGDRTGGQLGSEAYRQEVCLFSWYSWIDS